MLNKKKINVMKSKSQKRNMFFTTLIVTSIFLVNCSGNNSEQNSTPVQTTTEETSAPAQEATTEEVDPLKDKGVGPVSSVEIGPLDKSLAEKGKTLFETKCSACHKLDTKYVGPALSGVTKRRTPEWIMNMMLNPVEMTQKDPVAKKLLEEHLTQMTFQDLTQDDARAILEYFRSEDEKAK